MARDRLMMPSGFSFRNRRESPSQENDVFPVLLEKRAISGAANGRSATPFRTITLSARRRALAAVKRWVLSQAEMPGFHRLLAETTSAIILLSPDGFALLVHAPPKAPNGPMQITR